MSTLGFWSRWRAARRLGHYARGTGGSPPPELLRRLLADIPERLPLAGPVSPSPRLVERARPPRRLPVAILAAALAAMVTAGLTMTLHVWDLLPAFRKARSAREEGPAAMPGGPLRLTAAERAATGAAGAPAVALPPREALGAATGGGQPASQTVASAPGLAMKPVSGAPAPGGAGGASSAAPHGSAPALQAAQAHERGVSSLRRAAARDAARDAASMTPGAAAEGGAPAVSGPAAPLAAAKTARGAATEGNAPRPSVPPAPVAGEETARVAAVPFAPPAEGPGAHRPVNVDGAESTRSSSYIGPASAPPAAPSTPAGSPASEKAARLVPAPAAPVREPGAPAAGMAAALAPPRPAPVRSAVPLRATFGGDAGTAGYSRLRQALLTQGRLPRPDAVSPEQLTGAFEVAAANPAAGTAGLSTAGLAMEGAHLPGPGRRYLLRVAVQGLAGPPRRDAVEVDFDPAVVARFQRVGAATARGAATALFEIEMQPSARPPGGAVVAIVRLPPAAAPAFGGTPAAEPGGPVLRLSGLRPTWEEASAALRIPGLALQLARALAAERPAEPLQALRRQAEALAAELPGDARTAELLLLVRRAADLAAAPPSAAPLRPAAPGGPPPASAAPGGPPPPPSDRRP